MKIIQIAPLPQVKQGSPSEHPQFNYSFCGLGDDGVIYFYNPDKDTWEKMAEVHKKAKAKDDFMKKIINPGKDEV